MVSIPGGSFSMGSSNSIDDYGAQPPHHVTVSAFYMGLTDVTQADYQALMGVNPSYFDTGVSAPGRPVEQVTWFDAALYCNARSRRDGYDTVYSYTGRTMDSIWCTNLSNISYDLTKNGYRLPTEAEWEYACRAGTNTEFYWGSDTGGDTAGAWFNGNCRSTMAVAMKPPNDFYLYDMAGNVWQWCNDWYGSYSATAQTNPTGPTAGSYRVLRGGSWNYGPNYLRSAFRYDLVTPGDRYYGFGFRCVRR